MLAIFSRIDWKLMVSVLVLSALGLLSLASSAPDLFHRQLIFVGVGLLVVLALTIADVRSFMQQGGFVLGVGIVCVLLLVLALFFAPEIKGNRAWIFLGSFQFQPSEIAKVALILFFSYFFTKRHVGIAQWRIILLSFLYAAVPLALVALQPDFGSALILFFIWAGFVALSGIPLRRVAVVGALLVVGSVLLWTTVFKDYQKERILGAFYPQRDPLGVNYSVIQSKIAIGAGGIFGKGFSQGTQVQLGFLPEAQTDFIFSAIAEEGGLAAVTLLLVAFGVMLVRILKMGFFADGNTLKFISLGTALLFFVQFFCNVGSATGFLPVIGVTLPFVSYGGSSILSNFILIGILQSWYVRK